LKKPDRKQWGGRESGATKKKKKLLSRWVNHPESGGVPIFRKRTKTDGGGKTGGFFFCGGVGLLCVCGLWTPRSGRWGQKGRSVIRKMVGKRDWRSTAEPT